MYIQALFVENEGYLGALGAYLLYGGAETEGARKPAGGAAGGRGKEGRAQAQAQAQAGGVGGGVGGGAAAGAAAEEEEALFKGEAVKEVNAKC